MTLMWRHRLVDFMNLRFTDLVIAPGLDYTPESGLHSVSFFFLG